MSTYNINRFINWLEAEKARGLVDLKGTCIDGMGFVTKLVTSEIPAREDLCAEFMRAIEAPDVSDTSLDNEVLPSYPGQCGTVRADSLDEAYDYFFSRFSEFTS
jgi:hypothetical protein